jgi:methyltransferase
VLGIVRVYELALNRIHVRRLRRQGATDHGRAGLEVIVLGQVLLFAGLLGETFLLRPDAEAGPVTWALLGIAALALALRHWCIQTLGDRWTITLFTLPGPLVARGPYRFLRHPNYVAVVIELVAFCAALQAWITLAAAGTVTVVGIAYRIRRENAILAPLRRETSPRQTS